MGSELRALVVGSGFEPLKAKPADLQSAPIGHSGNPPKLFFAAEAYLNRDQAFSSDVELPPSTTSACPVMYRALSLESYATTPAISLGLPLLPNGTFNPCAASVLL